MNYFCPLNVTGNLDL